jgi:hypothetical protein
MCWSGSADIVNQRGDKLSSADRESLAGSYTPGVGNRMVGAKITPGKFDPETAAKMFQNWLTGGGLPTKVDPSKIFSEATLMHGVNEKAAAGQGIAGLFGFGNMIGDLNTKAPMQAGVPYSVPPVPKLIGDK